MDNGSRTKPTVVAVQMDIAWEDKEANHARVRELLAADPPPPGALVVLPEMFATGFSVNVPGITETGIGATEAFLGSLARDLRVFIVAGLVTSPDGRGRNEAVVVSPTGEIIDRYEKIQPFVGGEKASYAAGERIVRFAWEGLRVSPFVCFDLRFPEHFRRAAMAGADLMLVIASWPVVRIGHWITLLQARAIENQCYVVGVNRTGNDPYLPYNGHSIVVDYTGAVIADAGEGEGTISAELDFAALSAYREKLPFLREMREEYIVLQS